jgi:hypothetical protein
MALLQATGRKCDIRHGLILRTPLTQFTRNSTNIGRINCEQVIRLGFGRPLIQILGSNEIFDFISIHVIVKLNLSLSLTN